MPVHAALVATCLIVAIADGDTMTALCNQKQVKIRLAEIDAPEKAQPFGQRSKQSLSDLCYQKQAEIRVQTKDRYGRSVARVICDGTDANAEQVARGMAWVYDKYVTDTSLYELQNQARTNKRGLWTNHTPIQPWEWRKTSRKKQKLSTQTEQ